jgi:hypothetical protein
MSEQKGSRRSSQTDRYDKREDRANDVKRHDNPNHPGMHSHDKTKAEADERRKDK